MPEPDERPVIGALFEMGRLLEEEARAAREFAALRTLFGLPERAPAPTVIFETTFEPEPEPAAVKHAVLARLLEASSAAWHKGSEVRH